MPYGLKYVTQFNSQPDADNPGGVRNATVLYTLQFLFKDYTGIVQSIKGGTTTAVQKCTLDDPLAPIKGQALDIQLLNYGNLPITSFYSDNDAGVQVILSDPGGVRFIGFIVQDDCSEIMVDYVHGIQLSATDGLGLLKDVILNQKPVTTTLGSSTVNIGSTAPHTLDVSLCFYIPPTGVPFIVSGGSALDGTYTITAVTVIGVNHYQLTVVGTVTNHSAGPAYVRSVGVVDLTKRQSLLTMIAVCLSFTNLQLITTIFCNIKEGRQVTNYSHFQQTYIDPQSFISGETYMNCFDVMSRVLETFGCQLMQVNGEWVIIHWFELRIYATGAIPGYIYDTDWLPVGTTVYGNTFNIGRTQLSRPLFSLNHSVLRPWKFVRKTFNYNTPKYLLKNYDLQTVGALLRSYVVGANTVYEYIATDWEDSGTPACERFVRVTKDTVTATEISRYIVLRNTTFDSARSVQSKPIEANIGDKVKFSFSFKTNISQGGSINIVFAVALTDGTTIKYIDELPVDNGAWINTIGFTYNIPSGDNSDQWHSIEIQSSAIPYSGLIYCYLAEATANPQSAVKETWYKDIRFEYTPFINDSTKIIGQIHKENRLPDVKNNLDTEIFIDDSPRNNIIGTLFMNSFTGLLQNLTQLWYYGAGIVGYRIGQLTSQEDITVRDTPRSKLEGGCIGLLQNAQPVSLGTNIVPDFYPTKTYIFGLLTVDYKRNTFGGTMWEIVDNSEAALAADYTFNYIYSTT